jgi:hypothetical protein
MACFSNSSFSLGRAAILACSVVVLTAGNAGLQPASAASGPFASFPGQWAGNGVIRVKSNEGERTERIRCTGAYEVPGSHDVNMRLTCKSDTYDFDLSGTFQADGKNHITGRWSENSRNVGGTAVGNARGDRFQIHVESSALSGNLGMVTKGRSQAVKLDAAGGGQSVAASITLHRRSR